MSDIQFMQFQDLDAFIKHTKTKMSRATITRYGQLGLMLEPKRKTKLSGLDDSRVYYNPLVPIEIITASSMFGGNYVRRDGSTKMARFTSDDIFWARVNFYIHHRDDIAGYQLYVKDYVTSIKMEIKPKAITFPLSMEPATLSKLINPELHFNEGSDPCLSELWHQYQQYRCLFSNTNSELHNAYVGVANHIYKNIYLSLLEKYIDKVNIFSY